MRPYDQSLSVAASVNRHVRLFRETVIPWQTVSGLAWLLAGMFCCDGPIRLFSDWTVIPLVVAMTSARFSGMCWNRLIDWQIDARNPRTCRRAVPGGRLAPRELAAYALLTLFLFLVSCFFLPVTGRWMGIGVAVALLLYSFAKRVSVVCHFILGGIHACLPIAGSLWQSESIPLPAVFLSLAACAAVSGTDILYALQDEFFDRRFGLFSLPACFGAANALETAAVLHAVALVACTFALAKAGLAPITLIVWGLGSAVLIVVWRSIWKNPTENLQRAFSFFLSYFSLASLITLALDRAWNALS